MGTRRRCVGVTASTVVLCLALGVLLTATGCTQAASDSGAPAKAAGTMGATKGSDAKMGSMQASSKTDPNAQKCADCAGKGMAPMVDGTIETVDGVQVIKVGVKDGYYNPNQFVAKANVPIKVVFSGNAAGCLGKPGFKELGKKVDFIESGSETIELGALEAGTYEFMCGMGMTGGKVVVE